MKYEWCTICDDWDCCDYNWFHHFRYIWIRIYRNYCSNKTQTYTLIASFWTIFPSNFGLKYYFLAMSDLNTVLKLSEHFADFDVFSALKLLKIMNFGLSTSKIDQTRPWKRLENRKKEVETRNGAIKPIQT